MRTRSSSWPPRFSSSSPMPSRRGAGSASSRKHERPAPDALAFAGGAACVGGLAMPGRVDDAIRIACVRRFPGTRAGLGADRAHPDRGRHARQRGARAARLDRDGGCELVDGPRRLPRRRCRRRCSRPSSSPSCRSSPGCGASHASALGRWLGEHTQCTEESGAALAPHLRVLGAPWHGRFPAPECALAARLASRSRSGSSAHRPRRRRCRSAPAGAAMQAGAGATLLIAERHAEGRGGRVFGAAQALVVVTGAVVILLISAWQVALRVRPHFLRTRPVLL